MTRKQIISTYFFIRQEYLETSEKVTMFGKRIFQVMLSENFKQFPRF